MIILIKSKNHLAQIALWVFIGIEAMKFGVIQNKLSYINYFKFMKEWNS